MILMLVIMLLGWLYLHWMVWGRETYAVGGNEEAARFSGIQVGWTKLRTYFICGLCAGIAGMISCGFYKSAATNTGLWVRADGRGRGGGGRGEFVRRARDGAWARSSVRSSSSSSITRSRCR